MPIGYTFMTFVEKSRQWSWNLRRDTCHSGSMREFEKENTVVGLPWAVGWLKSSSKVIAL
jgi:hypothetical protein